MGHASLEFSPLQLAVLTVSDTRDLASDSSGELLVTALKATGHHLADRQLVKDDIYQIRAVLSQWIASPHIQGVIITGGTGFTGRDMMRADVVNGVLEKHCEAIILSDSSKFSAVHPYPLGPAGRFNRVITDDRLPDACREQLLRSGLTVDIVPYI